MKNTLSHLPPIGLRIIKSAIAVFLCYLVYLLRDRQGIVFYSQLAVLWCIQPYIDTSLKKALQRTVGTFIGAFFGLLVILLNYYVFHGNPSYDLLKYGIISLMIIPIIYTTLLLHKTDAAYFSCVVFLSIVVMHISDGNPFLFVWNRILDTMIGIFIGVFVNSFHLPRKKNHTTLFVSGLDDTLLDGNGMLSGYGRVELNQMLDSGMHFTLSTVRTPASLIAPMEGIHLKLPVIAMDGAVLYDLKERKYIKSYAISYQTTTEVVNFIRSHGFHCFINAILEDTLVIYYQNLQNEAEKDIYQTMHTSLHRNYLHRELPEDMNSVYLMVIDETKRIHSLAEALEKAGYYASLKVTHYPSQDYSGYSYLKIYNKNAKKENMLLYLQNTLHCSDVITFGTIPGFYDYVVQQDNPKELIKLIKRLYEPVGFH